MRSLTSTGGGPFPMLALAKGGGGGGGMSRANAGGETNCVGRGGARGARGRGPELGGGRHVPPPLAGTPLGAPPLRGDMRAREVCPEARAQ